VNKAAGLLIVLTLLTTLFEATTLQVKAEPKTIVVEGDWMRIQGAISSANAGDTVFVKKGTYAESTIIIDRAITLLGEEANATIISNTDSPPWDGSFPPPPATVAINITADNVRISGFTITSAIVSIAGGGEGTQITRNIIENNVEVAGNNQIITGNTIKSSFSCSGSYNNVSANNISGYHERTTVGGSFNVVQGNLVTGGSGLEVDGDNNLVSKNNLANDTLSTGGSFNTVFGNTVVGNLVLTGSNNTFYGNYIQGIWMTGNVVNTFFYHNNFDFVETSSVPKGERTFAITLGVQGPVFLDNGKEGNWWSDYYGNDTNRDGIGDKPYVIYANDSRNYHYTDESAISNIVLTDNFPLTFPFDIENDKVVLPPVEPANSGSGSSTNLPTELVIASIVSIVAVSALAVLVYLKKRKRVSDRQRVTDRDRQ
jgi:nitrous oxidase accessory protein NosD